MLVSATCDQVQATPSSSCLFDFPAMMAVPLNCATEQTSHLSHFGKGILSGQQEKKQRNTIIFPLIGWILCGTVPDIREMETVGDREKTSSMHEVPFQSSRASPKMWKYFPHQESRWASKGLHICLGNIFSLEL